MAVTSETRTITYTPNGEVAEFSFPFRIVDEDNLVVEVAPRSDPEAPVTQTLGVDYTIEGVGEDAGGTVVFEVDHYPADDTILTIYREVDFVQDIAVLRNQGTYAPLVHEDAFDYGCFIDQQLKALIDDLDDRVDDLEEVVPGGGGDVTFGSPVEISDTTEGDGAALTVARSDHVHGHGDRGGGTLHDEVTVSVAGFMSALDKEKLNALSLPTFDAPVEISDTTESEGAASTFARSNHVHGHGDRGGGTLHAVATTSTAGFMAAADKTKANLILTGTLTTTDATPVALLTRDMSQNTAEVIDVRATAVWGSGGYGAGFQRSGAFLRGASTSSQVGSTYVGLDADGGTAADVTMGVATTTAIVYACGIEGTTIYWSYTAVIATRTVP